MKDGYIFAIGGGNNVDKKIFKKMYELSNNNNILIITDASTNTKSNHLEKTLKWFNQFKNIKPTIKNIKLKDTKTITVLKEYINNSGIIYFTGGHQIDLLNSIQYINKKFNISFRNILINFLKNGGILSGTSAGASIIGYKMPTGEIISKRRIPIYIKNNNLIKVDDNKYYIKKSLNLVPFLIDQHFTENNRHTRGISTAIDNKLKIVGIDENTGFYIKYGSIKLNKIGPNNITIYDGRNINIKKKDNLFIVSNLKVNTF